MATNSLTWFTVTGYIYDVEQQNPNDDSIQPVLGNVSAYIDFFPGIQEKPFDNGYAVLIQDLDHGDGTHGDTLVPLAPITARILNGAICSIAIGDPEGVELLAGSTVLNLAEPLFYHVRFRNVTYAGTNRSIANFAFEAPIDSTPVVLTSPDLQTYEYGGP